MKGPLETLAAKPQVHTNKELLRVLHQVNITNKQKADH